MDCIMHHDLLCFVIIDLCYTPRLAMLDKRFELKLMSLVYKKNMMKGNAFTGKEMFLGHWYHMIQCATYVGMSDKDK